jgi:DNA repair photolyase
MIFKEVYAKTILSKSKVHDYTINPYIGCEHGCPYCYARFMKRFTGHNEEWGRFVDVKINAARLLQPEIGKKKPDRVWISGVCDPYQPMEKNITNEKMPRNPIKTQLANHNTKSPLVKRDLELLGKFTNTEVGLTITTSDENIRTIFEPHTPSIKDGIETLEKLHSAALKTFATIAPLLPKAEGLGTQLIGKVDYVLIDKMNYHYADWVYKKHGL